MKFFSKMSIRKYILTPNISTAKALQLVAEFADRARVAHFQQEVKDDMVKTAGQALGGARVGFYTFNSQPVTLSIDTANVQEVISTLPVRLVVKKLSLVLVIRDEF